MTTKAMITTISGITAALIMCGWCNNDSPASPAGKKEQKVDSSDPKAVAMAFIRALAAKDTEEAVRYVIPVEREKFLKAVKKGIPPVPKNPEIKVRIKEDGVRADVFVLNAKPKPKGPPFGLDMKLANGKWWIVI